MKKIILWSVVLVLTVGILAASIWWLRRPQVIILGDGTKLTLLGVEYGKHHKFPPVKTKGRRTGGGGPASFYTTNDTLVAWILSEHKSDQWPNYQVLAYDEGATACVGNWIRNSRSIKNGMEIAGVQLDAFQRRDRKIYLRVMSYGQRGQQVAKGQFVISNPARGSFPKWTPDPLPDTQSDDDLNVTLTRLNYGVRGFNYGNSSGKMKNDPMSKAVLAAFHAEQKGIAVTNWQPVRIETSDATGNHVFNNSWSNGRDDNGDATMTYQWGLWPDEPAWKLRVEMSQTSGFKDDELCSVSNVPIQPGSWQDLWNNGGRNNRNTNSAFAETTLNGTHLKIFPAIQITDQNFGNSQKQGGVRVVADPDLPEGFRLTVTATDERGRKLQNWGPNGGGGGNYTVQFPDIRNAQSLNLTIALHQSRFMEFTVKPQKAGDANVP
jgi:hypothetical protein